MLEWFKQLLSQFWDYLKFWVVVNEYEEILVLRNGHYHRTLKPGTYPKWPFAEYTLNVHVKKDTLEIEPICITTVDAKTITIGMYIEYEIFDARLNMVETNDAITNMKDEARGEMSDLLEDITWEDIKKKTTKNALRRQISAKYEEMGVRILDLKFTDKCETRAYRLLSGKEKNINAI